ncbi:MAG: DUF1624 domain-containing protein [Gemmatimonadetes bacterium]|nr:DUF1624 domain-containing protein [Gemmatimonadota bacterium]
MNTSASATGRIAAAEPPQHASVRAPRVDSIDIVRGAVMILMAIDHVRVYSGLPAGGPTAGIFFTRWVTHFCAPAFVFFAGTSAFLHGHKLGDPGKLSRFLLIRGAWLVLLELTFLRVAWTFNLDYAHYLLAGVIWVIGWCMILMGGVVRLPIGAIAAVGLVIIAGHNIVDFFRPQVMAVLRTSESWWIWNLLYFGFTDGRAPQLGAAGPRLVVLYSIVPWIGVMAAGYAFGVIVRMAPPTRRRICWRLGLGATVLFVVLRVFDVYGNPSPWRPRPPVAQASAQAAPTQPGAATTPSASGPRPAPPPATARSAPVSPPATQRPAPFPAALAFLNTTKYPASLLFLLMTLGPTIALLPLLEGAGGVAARVLTVFGRVPLFYYLLHIPVIHGVALIVSLLRLGSVSPWLFANHPMMNPPVPEGYTWSLELLYLVTIVVVAGLYFPCRWFAELKQRRRNSWLSYL